MVNWRVSVVVVTGLFVVAGVQAEEIKVVGWNVQSGQAKPAFVGDQIADFAGIDLWGFSEVQAGDAAGYAAKCAVGETGTFRHFVGTTGGSDRLVIVYNESKMTLVEKKEMLDLSAQTGRAPLSGKFKLKASGTEFIFMVNHLHRGKPEKRLEQANGLREWAKTQPVPAVLTGDYNFDYNPVTNKGNREFNAMMKDDVFEWAKPVPFRPTYKGSQKSILDFVFLSGTAKDWTVTSDVVALSDDAVDTLKGSDHRPVRAVLNTATPRPAGASAAVLAPPTTPASPELAEAAARNAKRNQILAKIGAMENQLVELRRLVKELGDE